MDIVNYIFFVSDLSTFRFESNSFFFFLSILECNMSRNKLVSIGLSVYNNFIFNYFYEKSSNFKDLTKSNIWARFMIMIQ